MRRGRWGSLFSGLANSAACRQPACWAALLEAVHFAAEPIPLTLKAARLPVAVVRFLIFVRDVSVRAIILYRSIRAIVHAPVIRNL